MKQQDFIAGVIGSLILEKAAMLEEIETLRARLAEAQKPQEPPK